jgi:hypothetical protein
MDAASSVRRVLVPHGLKQITTKMAGQTDLDRAANGVRQKASVEADTEHPEFSDRIQTPEHRARIWLHWNV